MIHANRQHIDQKRILFRRIEAELRARAEQQRPYVHCSSRTVRRYVFCVQRDGQLDTGLEVRLGDLRHADEGCRVLHALGVLLGPEDVDAVV